ncbi:RHTO0S24e01728g1_1 [Rhodotorula toruloides]|uniref:RHTO0S24e01728g1_1 n=1 Tax=Rhodotorula toruloides TaxID=5286 RepID=A0A061BIP6_RHOTO|nr:RHTO0S24e01728g1_1 [Rhodotorula toruloides]
MAQMSTETLSSTATTPTEPARPSPSSSRSSSPPPPSSSVDLAQHDYPPSRPDERRQTQLAQPDRGKAAYLFLLGAFSIETLVWGLPSCYGVFLDYYQREGINGRHAGSSLLPLVGTVASGFIYLLGPPISILLNPRPRWRLHVIRLGAVLCSLSLLLSSFARESWQLLLTQGLLYSIGGSMAYYSTFYFLQEWFVERRGFANGVCFAGTAAGGLVLPFILNALLERYGAALTLRALAVSTSILLGAAVPLVRPRLPLPPKNLAEKQKKEDDVDEAEAADQVAERPAVQQERVTLKNMAKNLKLWVFLVANIGQAFGYFITLLYLPTYATSLGLSGSEGSALLACVNGACVLSRVGMGILSDKHSPHRLGLATMLASSVAVLVLWGVAATSLAPLLVFSVVMGLASGGWTSMYSAIINSVVRDDPSLASHLFSTLSFTRGLGAVLCAPISSALISHPFAGASKRTAYGAADGRFGGVVLFAGLAMGMAAGCEGVEALLG